MPSTKVLMPILGKRIRVTTVDDCGNVPDAGTANSYLVTDGFISVQIASEIESGAEIMTKKADGTLCINERLSDTFKRLTLTIEFCGVNPNLLGLVTSAEPYVDAAGDTAGFTVGEGLIDKKFALEIWTGLAGADCDNDSASYGYVLLPFVASGSLGDIQINGTDAVTFTLNNCYTLGNNAWGVGPFEPVPDNAGAADTLPTALDPSDHMLLVDTTIAPPTASAELQSMPV